MMDISAIINLHGEGDMAASSLESLYRATDVAGKQGVSVELIAALDRPDEATLKAVRACARPGLRILQLDKGDLGASRNAAVSTAAGEWVAFLDGDDLWDRQWLAEAFRAASADPRDVIWHPEVNVYFGETPSLLVHMDMEDEAFDLAALAAGNYWTALCFTRRRILERTPYPETDLNKRVGFEDWGWNIAAIAAGNLHKVVKGTGHAIRTRPGSLARTTASHGARPDISGLFRYNIAKT